MNAPSGSRLDRIDRHLLAPVVRRALACPDVRVTQWDCLLVKGDPTPPKGMICRVFGSVLRRGQPVPWSVFLKVPEPPLAHPDVLRREPFHRELLLHQSGILDDLPDGIAAPRCLGVIESTDDEPWMWLEDVAGQEALRWPVERFGVAGYHWGLLQGAFLAGAPLPDHPWLDTGGWVKASLARALDQAEPLLEKFRTHPLAGRVYDSPLGEKLRRLWAERQIFVDALDRMPRSLCHGDFCYPNLFARRIPGGTDQTVVIDWEYAGWRQIGGDIAGLIADSAVIPVRRKAAEPEEFTELVLDGYLSGLRDAGWKGDLRIARFACTATLALPWSLNLLSFLDGAALRRPADGADRAEAEQRIEDYVRRQEFLLALAEESRKLLPLVLHGA